MGNYDTAIAGLIDHTEDTEVHVQPGERAAWDAGAEAAEQALRVSGIPAFEAAIPLRASVPASMSNLNASKTLRGYAPKDAATKAYHDFTREYLSKGGAVNG